MLWGRKDLMWNRYLWYRGSLEASSSFDVLIDPTSSHRSLLPEVREMTPFHRRELVSHVPKGCWLYHQLEQSFLIH